MTISGNPPVLNLSAAGVAISDVGLNPVVVRVSSPDYPLNVFPVDYYCTIEVQHCVTKQFSIAPVADVHYMINTGLRTIAVNPATFSDRSCSYTIVYSATYKEDGASIP